MSIRTAPEIIWVGFLVLWALFPTQATNFVIDVSNMFSKFLIDSIFKALGI